MVGWHHRLDGHEFEQTPEDSEGQGSLARCSPRGHRVGHNLPTEQEEACLTMKKKKQMLISKRLHLNLRK